MRMFAAIQKTQGSPQGSGSEIQNIRTLIFLLATRQLPLLYKWDLWRAQRRPGLPLHFMTEYKAFLQKTVCTRTLSTVIHGFGATEWVTPHAILRQ